VRVVGRAALVALVVAGCGGGSHFANQPKPPAPITVSAAIDRSHVRVSPTSFGAGPVTIIVSNQSGAPQTVTFQTNEVAGSEPGITRTAGPVADRNTTTIQANPREGTYSLSVKAAGVRPAAIAVGKPRRASSDQLAQP
jgi:hypothetical protein